MILSIELVMQCRTCRAPMAVNACVPELRCDRCQRAVPLSDEAWGELLADPVGRAKTMAERVESETTVELAGGIVRRLVRREAPRCRGCRAALDVGAVTTALGGLTGNAHGSVKCAACGLSATLRRPALAIPELVALFDEEAEALDPSLAPRVEATVVDCPKCGGALSLDGATRVVTCHYCSAPVQLSDEVWARLHPIRPVRAFYLLVEPATASQSQAAAFTYYQATRAVTDAAGNVYVAGSVPAARGEKHDFINVGESNRPYRRVVWSLDPELRLRWVHHCKLDEPRLALLHGETELVVWSPDDGDARVLGTVDGEASTRKLPMPLKDALELFADPDGSFIRAKAEAAERFTSEGQSVPLFNVKTGFWHNLTTMDHVTELGPLGGAFALSPSGYLFVVDSESPQELLRLRRYVRDGDYVSFTSEAEPAVFPPNTTLRALSDTLVILVRPGSMARMEMTAPDTLGRSSRTTSVDALTALPDGSLLAFREHGAMLRFANDLRKVWENAESARAQALAEASALED